MENTVLPWRRRSIMTEAGGRRTFERPACAPPPASSSAPLEAVGRPAALQALSPVNCANYGNDLTRRCGKLGSSRAVMHARVGLPLDAGPVGRWNRGVVTMIKLAILDGSAAAMTFVLGGSTMAILVAPQPSYADDCLLDTTNDGEQLRRYRWRRRLLGR